MIRRAAVVSFVLALGCTHAAAPPTPSPSPAPSAGESAAADASAPPATPAEPARPAVTAVAEADVRSLVESWLRAQNEGDFAAYERLYAPRFTGVRRSGPRVRRFDRAGWVADRQGMFRAAMQVAARDVAVDTAAGVATVRMTQEFTQGAFHDVGRKEIVIVRSGTNLQIAREEMLDSTVSAPGAATVPTPGADAYAPVIEQGGVHYAILGEAEGAWAEGAAELLSPGEVVVSRRGVRTSALPEALRGAAGQGYRFYAVDGTSCEATLGPLSVLSRVDVHFGVSQRWAGEDVDGERHAPYTPAEVAAEAFDMGAQVLVARVDGECGGRALWGRLASLPAVAAFRGAPAPAPLAAVVRQRFRTLPAWRAAEAAYRQDGNAVRGRSWDMHAGAAPDVTLWTAPNNGRRFAVVSASTMAGGCADFSASMTAVFEVTGAQTLVLQSDGAEPSYVDDAGAVDLDGDGRPEFVTADGLFRRQGTAYRPQVLYSVPNHDCSC
ncbi:MAG: nuclear transport factor 2 family protein [Polyangiales bacterium]